MEVGLGVQAMKRPSLSDHLTQWISRLSLPKFPSQPPSQRGLLQLPLGRARGLLWPPAPRQAAPALPRGLGAEPGTRSSPDRELWVLSGLRSSGP